MEVVRVLPEGKLSFPQRDADDRIEIDVAFEQGLRRRHDSKQCAHPADEPPPSYRTQTAHCPHQHKAFGSFAEKAA